MKRGKSQKFIALVLTICFALSILAVTSFSEEEEIIVKSYCTSFYPGYGG